MSGGQPDALWLGWYMPQLERRGSEPFEAASLCQMGLTNQESRFCP
jgi:hypothetical protein